MDKEEIEAKVRELIIKSLRVEADEISADTNLIRDLGADSLDCVEIALAVEDEFGIDTGEIDDANAKDLTVRKINEMVISKLGI